MCFETFKYSFHKGYKNVFRAVMIERRLLNDLLCVFFIKSGKLVFEYDPNGNKVLKHPLIFSTQNISQCYKLIE